MDGLQPAMDRPAFIASVQLAIEEARRVEAKIIQSANLGLRSQPPEEHAGLVGNMAAAVFHIQVRLLDRVRETALVALREGPDLFSAEVLTACRTLLKTYLEESKSRCLSICSPSGLEGQGAAAKDQIHFEFLLGAMHGIFDILRQITELDATRHDSACDEARGGD